MARPRQRLVADNVLAWQRPNGGWPKDIDMTRRPSSAAAAPSTPDSTIDNGATVTQIRLLDRVFAATRNTRHRDAAIRGLDYLFAAQYPNGGWPQFYPLRDDYSRHITFNDDAMSGVLALLEDIAGGRALLVRRRVSPCPRDDGDRHVRRRSFFARRFA